MKVLFIRSGNAGEDPISTNQGKSLQIQGIKVSYFNIIGKGIKGYIANILKLNRFIKATNPDITHAHYGFCGWVAYLAKPKKIPLILSYMGSDVLPFNKRVFNFNVFLIFINRALQKRADHVIVKSINIFKILTRKDGVSLIPNGVDFDRFKPLNKKECCQFLGIKLDYTIILFLGNPKDKNKNIGLVQNALTIINQQKLVLLTPYPIDSAQVPIYLNAADVLVLSSIYEGSPNVIKEAMACNCPIVSTDVGDVRQVISGTEGCFLTTFTPEDVAEKIKLALDFGKRTNGREHIQHLDSKVIAKKIIAIYEDILADK